jgi:D-sedoheptulose 7-phosphate isomerase
MHQIIQNAFIDSALLKREFAEKYESTIDAVADLIAESFTRGNKLMLFGNGGSAADTQHIAAEFVNRFKIERPPLPAIALTTDTSILTSISNDYDFSEVFSKQIKALGVKGDVAVAISTSGNSPNIIKGIEACQSLGISSVLLSGGNGGKALNMCDYEFIVSTSDTPRIQEVHIILGHVLCELVDFKLFQNAAT